jgi:hypothetical protein
VVTMVTTLSSLTLKKKKKGRKRKAVHHGGRVPRCGQSGFPVTGVTTSLDQYFQRLGSDAHVLAVVTACVTAGFPSYAIRS